ncbi:MAG: thioredoxin domain-containing protein, partial [Methylococcaceae bacterium]|nr:thioredoxin domain-containing protein [Methylococcaceae bacterium]
RRSGGWPLTVFLNPHNQLPFFTGTYFPPRPSHNLPAFGHVLEQAAAYYHAKKSELESHNTALQDYLDGMAKRQGSGEGLTLSLSLLEEADRAMARHFDREHGGFGGAPKFPHTSALQYLLERWHGGGRTRSDLRHMACFSLEQMARGGLYDHVGGGFYRYSVDGWWEIPHFEKMLYDNGPLLGFAAQAWQLTGTALFLEVAEETGDWVMREMQSREGGFYASLDADSEGEEGRFYLWRRDEVRDVLSGPEFRVASACLGLDDSPNFEGRWHLQRKAEPEAVAGSLGLEPAAARELLACAKAKLLGARELRVRPGRDGKILTSWNALMVQGMALAGRIFRRSDFIDSAERALTSLQQRLWQDGRLLAAYKDGQAKFPAYLDDHAFLLDACLDLIQSRWSSSTLEWARVLADTLLERFYDRGVGGFYFTAHDHEPLIHRPKALADESMPAGCGVAASALIRLGHLLGERRYLEAAERTLAYAVPALADYPLGHAALLRALQLHLRGVRTVVIRGQPEAMEPWVALVHSVYDPALLCLAIPSGAGSLPEPLSQWNTDLPVAALVCDSTRCLPPVACFQEFKLFIERTQGDGCTDGG